MMKRLIVMLLLIALSVSALGSCSRLGAFGNRSETESSFETPENAIDYTLSVKTEGNMQLGDITVCIYDRDKREDLIWAGTTNEDGVFSFKADSSKNYVAVLSGYPIAYKAESEYDVGQNTVIKLATQLLEPDYSKDVYKLGSIVKDFSVTDVNGKTYKISELLKENKAVILNFWFIGCGPCKMEVPYMQQA